MKKNNLNNEINIDFREDFICIHIPPSYIDFCEKGDIIKVAYSIFEAFDFIHIAAVHNLTTNKYYDVRYLWDRSFFNMVFIPSTKTTEVLYAKK